MCFLFSKGCCGLVVAPCPQAMHSGTGVDDGAVDPASVHPGVFPSTAMGPWQLTIRTIKETCYNES